jgi:TRAP transporter TAXI family solute receptor
MKTIHRMCGIAAFALACGGAQAGENYILCGGSPGGLWSLLGSGVDAAVKAVDPESTVTYQTSSGGFANIVQINSGACDLAIVHVAEGLIARKGEAPFTEPTEGFSAVSVMYDWAPMQWVIDAEFAAEHGLSSIADLASAKPPIDLVVNRRGILPSTLAEESLKLAGVTFADIESWGGSVQYAGSKSAEEIMRDRKGHMWVNAMFVGTGSIRAIAESRPITLLSTPADVTAAMGEAYGSIPFTVPASGYDWLDADVETFGARAALIASDDLDAATVEKITGAMVDNIDKIQSVHSSMAALSVDLMKSLADIPYHPGAQAAYAAR